MATRNFSDELRRRNIPKAIVSYLAVGWLLLQAGSILFPVFNLDLSYQRILVIVLLILFPVWIGFAWFYDITTKGVVRTQEDDIPDVKSNQRSNLIIIGILAAAVILLLVDRVFNFNNESLRSIAVLPFDNLSGDDQQGFYADGMHDELIGHLAKLGKLRVISRTSMLRYKMDKTSLVAIANDLGVDLIVEGSLMKYGDSVRIQVQLIEAKEHEKHLWNRMYTKAIKNVLNMHSEVTKDIAKSIRLKLSPKERDFLEDREVNPDAYNAVLRGRFHLYQFTPGDIQLGLQNYQNALEIDPDYAEAHAGISFTGGFLLVTGAVPPHIAGEMMLKNAKKSLQLNPNLADAHAAMAAAKTWFTWNWEEAANSWKRSLELDSNNPNNQIYYGHFLGCMGRFEESITHGKKAINLDPYNPFFRGLFSVILSMAGDYKGAEEQIEIALKMDPNNPFPLYPKIGLTLLKGEREMSFKLFKDYLNSMGVQSVVSAMEIGYSKGGVKEGIVSGVTVLKEMRKQVYIRPHLLTIAYDIAGETKLALDWLDSSYVYRDHDMVYAANGPYSSELKLNPRFQQIIEKMNFPDN